MCAWISIPADVPFTLQTFAIFTVCGLLGGRRGTVSVLVYLLLGAVGAPVFAGFRGGFASLLGTTGGYLVGFVLLTLIIAFAQARWGQGQWVFVLSAAVGLLVCYAFGTAWFLIVYTRTGAITLGVVLAKCVLPFLLPDAVTLALAVSHARPALTMAPTNTSAVAARRNTVMPALLGSRRRIYFRQPSQ